MVGYRTSVEPHQVFHCACQKGGGGHVTDDKAISLNETSVIESLGEEERYKFLGVLEGVKQEERQSLQSAAKAYLQRLSSPFSDYNKMLASNQFALPVLTYLMWTLHWTLTDLIIIDREVRKVVVAGGRKHPSSSTALFYLPGQMGGRGLRLVENEYR